MSVTSFSIREHVDFDEQNRAICPSCYQLKGNDHNKRNLSVLESGAYKCHRGCTPSDIREAIGVAKTSIIPTALAKPAQGASVSPQKVIDARNELLEGTGESARAARQWLADRGFTPTIIRAYNLGLGRSKVKDRHLPSIAIPIPTSSDRTSYYQKKRVAPWLLPEQQPPEYKPWSQYGIPAMVYFTSSPENASQTWLCEGEWDAMMLNWLAMESGISDIAIASFTCGCGNVPNQHELDKLPGTVTLFYDRNDQPDKHGKRPGEEGERKVCAALKGRGKVARVPMPDDCTTKGWDVSDAIQHGFTWSDFAASAGQAIIPKEEIAPDEKYETNPLRSHLVTTDQLIARAPEYVEWLVPDLLTTDELIMLGAPPRAGKSLMCLGLAHSIASGQNFLDRPVIKGSVLYVNMEDSDAKVRERIEAQQWEEGLPIHWLDTFKLNEMPHLIEIASELPDLRLIILDTFSRIRSDDISESSAEMSQVLEPLQEFAKSHKVCVLLVHHTRKLQVENATVDDLFDSLRGNTAIRGTCRGSMVIAPGSNHYRLAVENGWNKLDLKIRIDPTKAEWHLMGQWNPSVSETQEDSALNYLNKVGQASIAEIAEATTCPKRSLYTVLDRLAKNGLIEKLGRANYKRPIQQIQHVEFLLNSSTPCPDSLTGSIQQNSILNREGDHVKSDHVTHPKHDHFSKHMDLLNPLVEFQNADPASVSTPVITFKAEKEGSFVEYSDQGASSLYSASDTGIQQKFNKCQHVECKHIVKLPESDQEPPKSDQESSKSDHDLRVVSAKENIATFSEKTRKNDSAITVGDIVIAKESATWFRRGGSSEIDSKELPPSKKSALVIPISLMGSVLFEELQQPSEVLKFIEGDRVKVKNQKTSRESVFSINDVQIYAKAELR